MAEWTREKVEERFSEASAVLAKLPGLRVQGYFSTWPDIVLTAREVADQEPRQMKVLPSARAISRMEETITWNRFLHRFHANLVWARADGAVEAHLPPVRRHPGNGGPALGIRALRHHLAAERTGGEPQAGHEVHDRADAEAPVGETRGEGT